MTGARVVGAVVAALFLSACPEPTHTGTLGTPVAADFESYTVPIIEARVDGSGVKRLIIDTGSAFELVMDDDHIGFFGVPPPGPILLGRSVDVEAFGVTVHDVTTMVFDFLPADIDVDGVIGMPFFEKFDLMLDPKNQRVALLDVGMAAPLPSDALLSAVRVPFTLDDTGRPNIKIRIEDLPDEESMMVDTGATGTIISADLMGKLPQEGRPSCCESENYVAGGTDTSKDFRIKRLALTAEPEAVVFEQLAVSSGGETHNEHPGYLGWVNTLELFVVEIRVGDNQMVLHPYVDPSHVDATPYWGTGIVMHRRTDGSWYVGDLHEETSGAESGAVKGDDVLTVQGTAVTGMGYRSFRQMFNTFTLGDTVIYGVRRDGTELSFMATVEELLPEYR